MIDVQALFKQVQDSQGTITILHPLNFKIEAGSTVAIVGSSGSGKSTLLGLLAGLDTSTGGKVVFAGKELGVLNEDERAKLRASHVGFVFQSFQLLPQYTALENVMLPLELLGQPAREAATAMLNRVGLSQRLHHYPKTLSGGEQQRVALARACVVKPQVLFADEPTGSLDTATGEKVMDLLFELNQEIGATLVLVTHDPNIARRCARQIRLEAGAIVSDTAIALAA